MVLGLGVDIVEIERMAAAIERRPRIKERLFSEDERWYCEHKAHPETHYALRFAAKEAVLKALGTGFEGMNFQDVEVVHDPKGRPLPRLYGAAKAYADKVGVIEMHLSLSYTHTTAVASAVAITADARPKRDEHLDPKEVLASEFKELRALLDEFEESVDEADTVGTDALIRPQTGNDVTDMTSGESLDVSKTSSSNQQDMTSGESLDSSKASPGTATKDDPS
jgi:holo-[acyl-carrier protein] synthase